MKGNNAVRMWRSFIVDAAGAPRTLDERRLDAANDEARPGPVAGSHSRAWDPYEVWLKRVKEPRDRRGMR